MSLITVFLFIIVLITVFLVEKENKNYMFNILKNKKADSNDNEIKELSESKKEKTDKENVIIKINNPINISEYAKYTVLDYSIRILSYPEETTRYYAVVSLTGGQFKDSIANLIISYNGGDSDAEKKSIWNYGLIRRDTNPYISLISLYEHVTWNYTFDGVKDMLNKYIKNKNNGEEQIGSDYWKAYYKDYAYYFDTKEDALYALCQFKKIMDERIRKKALSVNNISETEIKVTFTD